MMRRRTRVQGGQRAVAKWLFPGALCLSWGCSPRSTVTPEFDPPWVIAFRDDDAQKMSVSILFDDSRTDRELPESGLLAIASLRGMDVFSAETGEPLDLQKTGLKVSSRDRPALPTSCNECSWYRAEGPMLIAPGDRCPLPQVPAQGYRMDGSELIPDQAGLQVLDQVRLDWPGDCNCMTLPTRPTEVEATLVGPPTDAAPGVGSILASDGTLAVRSPAELTLVRSGERRSIPVNLPGELATISTENGTRFLLHSGGKLVSVSFDQPTPQPLMEVRSAYLYPYGAQNRFFMAASVFGLFANRTVLYDCTLDPWECESSSPPDACALESPSSVVDWHGEPLFLMEDGTTVTRREGQWSCGPKLSGDPAFLHFMPVGRDTVAACTSSSVHFYGGPELELLATYPLEPSWACVGVAPTSSGLRGVIVSRVSAGSIKTLLLQPGGQVDEVSGSRSGFDRDLFGMRPTRTATVYETFEGSVFVDDGGGPVVRYGREEPESSLPMAAAARDRDFIAIRPSGEVLVISVDGTVEAGGTIQGLDPTETVAHVALTPLGHYVVLSSLAGSHRARWYQEDWTPFDAESVPVPLENITDVEPGSGDEVYILSGRRVHRLSRETGVEVMTPAPFETRGMAVFGGMGWAVGPAFLYRFGSAGGESIGDAYDLDILAPAIDQAGRPRTAPLDGLAVHTHCEGRTRIDAIEVSQTAADRFDSRLELTIQPNAEGRLTAAQRVAATGIRGTPRDEVRTTDWLWILAGGYMESNEAGLYHPAPPVTQVRQLRGAYAPALTTGPFGRLTVIKPGAR